MTKCLRGPRRHVGSLGSPGGHLVHDEVNQNHRQRWNTDRGQTGQLGVLRTPRRHGVLQNVPKFIEVQMYHKNAGDFGVSWRTLQAQHGKGRGPEKLGNHRGKARRILNLTDGSEKEPYD